MRGYIKTKKLNLDNGAWLLNPVLNLLPKDIDVFFYIENEDAWLQTEYLEEDKCKAVQILLDEYFGETLWLNNIPETPKPQPVTLKPIGVQPQPQPISQPTPKPIKVPLTPKTQPEPSQVDFNYGRVISPSGLNIRSTASTEGNIVSVLEDGQRFKIVDKVNGWYQIDKPVNGFIDSTYTEVSQTPNTVSSKLVDFTASWEGFSAEPYLDAGGNWTVGYGDCTYNIKPAPVTQEQAWRDLENTLNSLAKNVHEITQGLNLNQAQFDSLVDFAYNLGIGSLTYSEKTNGLVAAIIQCTNAQIIISDFEAWDHCDGRVLEGLLRRRKAEAQLFIYGDYNNN